MKTILRHLATLIALAFWLAALLVIGANALAQPIITPVYELATGSRLAGTYADAPACAAAAEALGEGQYRCTPVTLVRVPPAIGAPPDTGHNDDPAAFKGDVYFVGCGTAASDANDGKTPATAWATTHAVRARTSNTEPGWHGMPKDDSAFLFQRGCKWDGYLTLNGNNPPRVTFASYGTGPRPRIEMVTTPTVNKRPATVFTAGGRLAVHDLEIAGNATNKVSGVSLTFTPGSEVKRCWIHGHWYNGISYPGGNDKVTHDLVIEDNLIEGNAQGGASGGGAFLGGPNLRVLHNTFKDNGTQKLLAHALYAANMTDAVIAFNKATGSSNLGIVVHGVNDRVQITDNELDENNNGLMVSGGYSSAETFDHFTIARNKTRRNGTLPGQTQGYGMLLYNLTNSTVTDNVSTGNRYGSLSLNAGWAPDSTMAHVVISGNTFDKAVTVFGTSYVDVVLGPNEGAVPPPKFDKPAPGVEVRP